MMDINSTRGSTETVRGGAVCPFVFAESAATGQAAGPSHKTNITPPNAAFSMIHLPICSVWNPLVNTPSLADGR